MLRRLLFAVLLSAVVCSAYSTHAASAIIDASTLVPNVEVAFSPRSGSFVEGSTFQVPVILDTNGASINGIEVRINFDASKLSIVNASAGQSIIGVWVEPPAYDNTRGTASYVGVVPNGIVTDSGVVGTITFRAKSVGRAVLSVRADSNILLNNGLGSAATMERGRAEYTIIPKAPGGVAVYSETHPSQSEWYNNASPVVAWDTEEGVTGFSYVLDTKPNTVPDNAITGTATAAAYEKLADGLWYFHIKPYKNGVWGAPTHFLMRIDTTPPAGFKPEVSYVLAAAVLVNRTFVSFFTTDNLSGIDHYEVGIIDKASPLTESPAFVDAESPFQIPVLSASGVRVVVRALDKAGNVRDESVDVRPPSALGQFIEDYLMWVILGVLVLIIVFIAARYFFGHHFIASVRRAWALARRDIAREEATQAEKDAREATAPVLPATRPQDKDEPGLGGS